VEYQELNLLLKNIVRELLKKYPKSHVVAITLGLTSANMFNKFVDNDETMIGIRPLLRVLENLGYDLQLVPVPKGDDETKKQLDEMCRENFIEHVYEIMTNILESESFNNTTRPKSGIGLYISDLAKEIVEKI